MSSWGSRGLFVLGVGRKTPTVCRKIREGGPRMCRWQPRTVRCSSRKDCEEALNREDAQNCKEVICQVKSFPSLALGVASDEAEQVWVWEYETEEGAHDLYMDIGEEIRFRVVDETFVDTSPTGPSSAEASTSSATEEVQKKEAPYTLVVTMCIIRRAV